MHDLQVAVNLSGWRIYVRRRDDQAFQKVIKRVFQRDSYSCWYCGFQAMQYQQVVNADGNYANNQFNNLVTACCFCAQCLFLESVGMDEYGGGQLIFLPELGQADLNSFCHVLFCAMGNGTGYQDTAKAVYRDLKFRAQPIEDRYGNGTSQPAVLGQLLLEQAARSKEPVKKDLLKDMRLLPSYESFKVPLQAWAEAALEELAEESK